MNIPIYCPRCAYEGEAEIPGGVIMPTPHEPLFECPACKMQYRLGFINCLPDNFDDFDEEERG